MEAQPLSQQHPHPPQSIPQEQLPLKEERKIEKLESGAQPESEDAKSTVKEVTEKIKKPTIGVSLIIFLILNLIQFFVGITTTKECPLQPIIPIYLAIAGALGIATKIMPIANRNKRFVIVDRILGVLFVIEFVWMILGSYWVYSIYKPDYNYCNKTAYLLAFWLLTIHYICLILAITIPCCIVCCCCIWTLALVGVQE